jgi:hypothetical protein
MKERRTSTEFSQSAFFLSPQHEVTRGRPHQYALMALPPHGRLLAMTDGEEGKKRERKGETIMVFWLHCSHAVGHLLTVTKGEEKEKRE